MPKRIRLEMDAGSDDVIIGISCHKRDYWLAYHLNNILKWHLARIGDLPVRRKKTIESLHYPLFHYHDPDNRIAVFMLANYHPQGVLFPEYRNLDYFLLLNGQEGLRKSASMAESIRKIPHILTATVIRMDQLKDAELFYTDLEMHLMEINRSAGGRIA
ncbi:MAG: IPExxxVDY family protein [Bacteroidales bacterium]|nr:IPExxxVDY family protein [Bacteroidales bacterium]